MASWIIMQDVQFTGRSFQRLSVFVKRKVTVFVTPKLESEIKHMSVFELIKNLDEFNPPCIFFDLLNSI